ncbi:aldehyde dehydrogenase family protein [Saccharopolyspora elongata]|uniref:aldehyde dehydrogenase family protein n=1 Tax=Saccharopolyspora elongata TaxID=2530387 RepID=UPI001A9DC390|nr:aldehyde dehydrogenase family protein [Saccharopolyspora elongata]
MTAQHGLWTRNFVDGQFVEPDTDRGFEQVEPATGRLIARVHEADAALVDRAVQAARRALANGWADTPVRERAALLRRAADRIEERFARLRCGRTTCAVDIASRNG